MEDSFIVGKIIKIPNEYTVIINAGENCEFIEEGDVLEIYEPGYEIIDPETEEILGTYDYIKDEVMVDRVYEKFSVCRKIKTTKKSNFSFAISPLLSQDEITTYQKLNVDENQIEKNKLTPKNTKISIGDLVRLK